MIGIGGKGKAIKIVAIVLGMMCVLCSTPLYLDTFITFARNLLAPRTRQVDVTRPRLLYEFSSGAYQLHWENDASHIVINISNWTSSNPGAPDTIADFNLGTGEVIFQEETDLNSSFLQSEAIARLGIDPESTSWTFCDKKNLVVVAGGFEGEQYWLRYWENEKLINTFLFSSEQWPVDYLIPSASLEFSPSCNKVTLVLSGWIYWEGDGKEELWLLDIPSESLNRLIMGKIPIFGLWDYSVQHVSPSWSPNEEQFVFGGWTFGLEIYDMSKSSQRILTRPELNLYNAEWSPSGKWIAAIQAGDDVDRIYVFSPDGSLYSFTDTCDLITDYWWAPNDDKLAFLCNDYLWLWELE